MEAMNAMLSFAWNTIGGIVFLGYCGWLMFEERQDERGDKLPPPRWFPPEGKMSLAGRARNMWRWYRG